VKTYVATKNPGKLGEIKAIFGGSALQLETYPAYADVPEDATSYLGNAVLKARALRAQLRDDGIDAAVLADDSGLEVDALHGRPGLLSARYAGTQSLWPQRRTLLLAELQDVPEGERTARFVCVMTLLVPGRELTASIGVVEGRIVELERGSGGFGYDPIFLYPPAGRTFGELTQAEKNAVSHRRRAADALLTALRSEPA
jgi:non-canonical purine NTP pyrophosphatase (RdgB/HAM1 family)